MAATGPGRAGQRRRVRWRRVRHDRGIIWILLSLAFSKTVKYLCKSVVNNGGKLENQGDDNCVCEGWWMIVEVWFGYLFFIYKYADISQYLAKKPNTPEIVTRTRTSWPSCWHQHQGFRQTNRSSSRCSGDCLWQYQEGWLQRYSQAAPKATSKCVCCCQNFLLLWVSPSPQDVIS